ncbi:hypothetical protein SBA4_1130015 [Candidatus Sulfopaludibacter sp. SbA4]|nr:hypothetical protein SBA4_1130015 [Candidatus Sulfopaludibacter sp. SbA4]
MGSPFIDFPTFSSATRHSPVQYPRDAVGRHVELACQLGGAHPEFFQFYSQVFRRSLRQPQPPEDSPDGQSTRSEVMGSTLPGNLGANYWFRAAFRQAGSLPLQAVT